MNNPDQLTSMLTTILIVMVVILVILIGILIFVYLKKKKREKTQDIPSEIEPKSDVRKITKEYTKESVFKFLGFDKIEDNMIIQKNGARYLMVVECQGVNYDLMSQTEKVSIEEGFLQFLNTLRHPIQIYVQTRTVNLTESIENYRKKLDEIAMDLEKKRNTYLKNLQSGQYTKEQLNQQFYEVTKQTNLYEYGKDIIANTERMSQNKNVLNKKYYIIIPYYPEELGNGAFDKEEIRNLAFQELYTKSQSIIRTLAGCEVGGKILNSNELADLLYVAYNRDEAEVFSIDKAVRSGYEELYVTAPDVLDKTMRALDDEIDKKAMALVNEKIMQARSPKQQQIDQKRRRVEELIKQRAQLILKQNEAYLGKHTTETAINLIKEDETKEKGGNSDVEQEPKKKTRRRKKANTTEE